MRLFILLSSKLIQSGMRVSVLLNSWQNLSVSKPFAKVWTISAILKKGLFPIAGTILEQILVLGFYAMLTFGIGVCLASISHIGPPDRLEQYFVRYFFKPHFLGRTRVGTSLHFIFCFAIARFVFFCLFPFVHQIWSFSYFSSPLINITDNKFQQYEMSIVFLPPYF